MQNEKRGRDAPFFCVESAMRSPPLPTAVPWRIGLSGLSGFAIGCYLALLLHEHPTTALTVLLLSTGLPMWWLELRRHPKSPSPNTPAPQALQRRTWRLRGLILSTPVWAAALALNTIPLAGHGLAGFWAVFISLWPFALTALAWFVLRPTPGAPHGVELAGRWWAYRMAAPDSPKTLQDRPFPWTVLRDQLVKAFFLPLMISFAHDWATQISTDSILELIRQIGWIPTILMFLYLVDTAFATIGYLSTSQRLDAHIRSSNPYLIGWSAALICYPPFFNWLKQAGLNYRDIYQWGLWLSGNEIAIYAWGSGIVLLTAIYALSTVVFGIRFSNLTHRGILTHGPYRWTKHPAYLSKNISWWMISIPFIPHAGAKVAVLQCSVLLGINGIYWLRAKTEERHLMQDSAYREYAAWIDQHGLFARVWRSPAALLR